MKTLWTILGTVVTTALVLVLLFLLVGSVFGSVPPMPVIRPAPLQSPRAASVPKSTPMLRESVPLTEPAPVMWVEIQGRINILGCETNDPGCQLYFNQHVSAIHRAGYELTISFADTVNGDGPQVAWFGAAPYDRVSEFNWFQPEPQPTQRYFKSIVTIPILPASRTAAPAIRVNPALRGVTASSRKK